MPEPPIFSQDDIDHALANSTPIDRSARIHVPTLREAGYPVTYVEYDGPHAHQPAVVARAVDFFLSDPPDGV